MTPQEAIKKLWLLRNKHECLTYQEAEKISITNAEFVDAIQMAIEALQIADRLEADRNELKKRMEKMKYDFDFINSDRNILKAENEKLKAKIEESVECGADCDKCKNKCRAWQNGYNATHERECDNCEVIADMQNLKNVLSKLLFDYADDLRGDTE